ncbi:MAG: 2-oxoacid:acceptor oxidoreductase family protein [Pseudomonadota bacterium]|nr:MAG: 2-oxoacid:acceptor oxidoreductase family protein [Pseudomonadota bacterium]
MYRIRFHGRGGQGMKTASRILGTALFLEGYEVQDAPRYGAERRGAPIFAYVRADKHTINERGIIDNPDLVVVADDTLVPVPAAGVLGGIDAHTVLLINSDTGGDTWSHRLATSATVIAFQVPDGEAGATAVGYTGAACAAAAARLLGFLTAKHIEQAIHHELSDLGDAVLEANLHIARASFNSLADHAGVVAEGVLRGASDYSQPQWTTLKAEDVAMSAPVIRAAANSELSKTGSWRVERPVIDYERCNRCWWVPCHNHHGRRISD